MKIYAFYDSLGNFPGRDDYKKLIDIWQKSWIYYGWDPVILTLDDAKKHKDYQRLLEISNERPTVNRKDFETLCFLRWLSMFDKSGWYCDVDMINYGFIPHDYGEVSVTTQHYSIEDIRAQHKHCGVTGASFDLTRELFVACLEEESITEIDIAHIMETLRDVRSTIVTKGVER